MTRGGGANPPPLLKAVISEYVYETVAAVVGVGATEGLADYGRIAMDINWSQI